MLHPCCLLTGAQAEGRRAGPRPGRIPWAPAAWRGDGSSCRPQPVALAMAARRAGASSCPAHGPRVDAVTPGVSRPRGRDGGVAPVNKRPENAWASRPGAVSCRHADQRVDDLNLLPTSRPGHAPRLPLPDQVPGLVSLDRAPRRGECTNALRGRHASFERSMNRLQDVGHVVDRPPAAPGPQEAFRVHS